MTVGELCDLMQVSYEEKAVNTRSHGVTSTAATNSADEDSTADNSLMARRRRRRERAQTTYIMQTAPPTVDGHVEQQSMSSSPVISSSVVPQRQQSMTEVHEGHQMTLAERRMLRAAYTFHSVDADDVFYDAIPTSNNSAAQKQL